MDWENIDKRFVAYAAVIVLGPACVLSLAFASQGVGPPSMDFILEHALLGVMIRTAYKSFDGFGWFYSILDFIGVIGSGSADAVQGAHGGAVADAA